MERIKRELMPQIHEADFEELFQWIDKKQIKISIKYILISKIKQTQKELNIAAAEQLIFKKSKKLNKPLILSKDLYLLDGHHRWFAKKTLYPNDTNQKCFIIDLNIRSALELLKTFPKVSFKDDNNNLI